MRAIVKTRGLGSPECMYHMKNKLRTVENSQSEKSAYVRKNAILQASKYVVDFNNEV
jgi:hypothetical protein